MLYYIHIWYFKSSTKKKGKRRHEPFNWLTDGYKYLVYVRLSTSFNCIWSIEVYICLLYVNQVPNIHAQDKAFWLDALCALCIHIRHDALLLFAFRTMHSSIELNIEFIIMQLSFYTCNNVLMFDNLLIK